MQLLTRYIRIYALSSTSETTPGSHIASPIRLVDFPSRGLRSEIHLGAVPPDILEALKFEHAWLDRVFRGGCKTADELRLLANNIGEDAILADTREHGRTTLKPHWYVTLCVNDKIKLPEDHEERLLGVDLRSWIGLDNSAFFDKHTEALDRLAAQTAISVAPYRYRWLVSNGPIVNLPTGVALQPLRLRMGRVRAFGAPALDAIDLSQLCAPPTLFKSVPMVLHFYLRSITEADRISRFFDAFRGLEGLCQSLETRLRSKASSHCITGTVSETKAVATFLQPKPKKSLRKSFATLALSLNSTEADADLGVFDKIYNWRNDLAHGRRKLNPNDAPDEEAFELLHKYLTKLI